MLPRPKIVKFVVVKTCEKDRSVEVTPSLERVTQKKTRNRKSIRVVPNGSRLF